MEHIIGEIGLGIILLLFLVTYIRIHWIMGVVNKNNLILETFHEYFTQGFTIITESELQDLTTPDDNHKEIVAWDNAGPNQAKAKK